MDFMVFLNTYKKISIRCKRWKEKLEIYPFINRLFYCQQMRNCLSNDVN